MLADTGTCPHLTPAVLTPTLSTQTSHLLSWPLTPTQVWQEGWSERRFSICLFNICWESLIVFLVHFVCSRVFSCVPSCSQVCRPQHSVGGDGWSERGSSPGLLRTRYSTKVFLHSSTLLTHYSTISISLIISVYHLEWSMCTSTLRNNLFRCWLNWSPPWQVKGEGGPWTACTLCAHPPCCTPCVHLVHLVWTAHLVHYVLLHRPLKDPHRALCALKSPSVRVAV